MLTAHFVLNILQLQRLYYTGKFCFGVGKQKHPSFAKVVASFLVNNKTCCI